MLSRLGNGSVRESEAVTKVDGSMEQLSGNEISTESLLGERHGASSEGVSSSSSMIAYTIFIVS